MRASLLPAAIVAASVIACSGPADPNLPPESERFGLSADYYALVQKEAKPGRKLDFFSQLPDEEAFSFREIVYDRKGMSLVLWGQSMRKMGMKRIDDAVALYEKMFEVELAKHERAALTNGFSTNLDAQ